jgi:thioredoxin 1
VIGVRGHRLFLMRRVASKSKVEPFWFLRGSDVVEAAMSTRELNTETFVETIKQSGIVLVDWWAAWCGPCRAFAPIYESVAAKHPDVVFGKVDTEASPDLAAAFRIRAIPTLMAFRDGVLLFAESGMLPAAALEKLIEELGKIDMDDVRKQMAEEAKRVAEEAKEPAA